MSNVVSQEVGLGGRLDATNIIENPVVCGITTLDLDHTQVLGTTLQLIAREVSSNGFVLTSCPEFE